MAAYVILEFTVYDPKLMEEYKILGNASVVAYDGRFVIRGGKTLNLEGNWDPQRLVCIEFPSFERAQEWWNSEAYVKAKAIREKAADTKVLLLEGV